MFLGTHGIKHHIVTTHNLILFAQYTTEGMVQLAEYYRFIMVMHMCIQWNIL